MGKFHKGVESFSIFPWDTRPPRSHSSRKSIFSAGMARSPWHSRQCRWAAVAFSDTCTSSAAWHTPTPRGADGPPQTAPALQRGYPAQVCRSLIMICRWLEPPSSAAFPSLMGRLWKETKADQHWILQLMYKCFDYSITRHCCRSFRLRRTESWGSGAACLLLDVSIFVV